LDSCEGIGERVWPSPIEKLSNIADELLKVLKQERMARAGIRKLYAAHIKH